MTLPELPKHTYRSFVAHRLKIISLALQKERGEAVIESPLHCTYGADRNQDVLIAASMNTRLEKNLWVKEESKATLPSRSLFLARTAAPPPSHHSRSSSVRRGRPAAQPSPTRRQSLAPKEGRGRGVPGHRPFPSTIAGCKPALSRRAGAQGVNRPKEAGRTPIRWSVPGVGVLRGASRDVPRSVPPHLPRGAGRCSSEPLGVPRLPLPPEAEGMRSHAEGSSRSTPRAAAAARCHQPRGFVPFTRSPPPPGSSFLCASCKGRGDGGGTTRCRNSGPRGKPGSVYKAAGASARAGASANKSRPTRLRREAGLLLAATVRGQPKPLGD